MAQTTAEIGLSPKEIEQIKAAQKRHSLIDPGCEKLTPNEFINWHPAGGISWEERARRMAAAGVQKPKEDTLKASGPELVSALK